MAGVKIIDQALNTTGNASLGGDLKVVGTASGLKQEVIRQSADSDTAITLTVTQSGALVLLDEDEAYAITLPAITSSDIGTNFTIMETVASNNDRTVNTAYDNDYWVGGVHILPSAAWAAGTAQDDGVFGLSAGGTDVQITFDDDLANGAGHVGSWVTVTAVLTGNVEAGGGAKLVWAVSGNMGTADPDGTGAAVFT
jgi:hypothetical protein